MTDPTLFTASGAISELVAKLVNLVAASNFSFVSKLLGILDNNLSGPGIVAADIEDGSLVATPIDGVVFFFPQPNSACLFNSLI